MPAERLPMQKIKEVLRLRHLGLSTRRIAASLQIGRTTVGDYLCRAKAARISWPLPPELGETELSYLLFVNDVSASIPLYASKAPTFVYELHMELDFRKEERKLG